MTLSIPRRGALRRLVAAGTATVAVAAALGVPGSASAAPEHRERHRGGQLVLVGGALEDDNATVYREIVRRAGGSKARIGVITAASVPPSQDEDAGTPDASNSEANGAFYSDLLERYGAGDAEWIPIDLDRPQAAYDARLARRVKGMTGFFFGGGDQYRYVTLLTKGAQQKDTPVLSVIRDRFEHGAVVAGTSAGTQIQAGRDMITGGESWQGLRDGSEPGYFDDATKLGYLPRGGFGFFRSGLLDTHFDAWGRQGRSIRLASDTHHRRVFGVDPDTALVVDRAGTSDERLSVIGTNGVSVLDLADARTRTTSVGWSISRVRWSWLTAGDRFRPRKNELRPAPSTRPSRPSRDGVTAQSTDVFSSLDGDGTEFVLLDLARDLARARVRSTSGTTLESDPRFTVRLTKGSRFSARTRDGSSTASFRELNVAIGATR